MPERSSKPKQPHDIKQRAASVGETATGNEPEPSVEPEKNPHAVALGRLGGMKGGKARAATLTPEERQEIARKAAAARWSDRGTR